MVRVYLVIVYGLLGRCRAPFVVTGRFLLKRKLYVNLKCWALTEYATPHRSSSSYFSTAHLSLLVAQDRSARSVLASN